MECSHEYVDTFAGFRCKKCGNIKPTKEGTLDLLDWHPFGISFKRGKK